MDKSIKGTRWPVSLLSKVIGGDGAEPKAERLPAEVEAMLLPPVLVTYYTAHFINEPHSVRWNGSFMGPDERRVFVSAESLEGLEREVLRVLPGRRVAFLGRANAGALPGSLEGAKIPDVDANSWRVK